MLYLMRKYARSWLIKLLLGAIVVVFVLWGVGSYRSQRATRVASVNGETITLEEYKETYRRNIEQLRQQFGNRLDDDLIKLFRVKQQTPTNYHNKYNMIACFIVCHLSPFLAGICPQVRHQCATSQPL